MKRKVKYLISILLLLTLILVLLIRLNYPLQVSKNTSIFHMIPYSYWILIILIPATISITFLIAESKLTYTFLGIIYFFILFSYFLFFIIPPAGPATTSQGHWFSILENANSLSVEKIDYFSWPIYFLIYNSFIKILNTGHMVITILLFSFLLIIPLIYSLYFFKKSHQQMYFILPVVYIIVSFYFIRSQWVPQFVGLIFLMFTIGAYLKYKKNPTYKLYILILFFYIICIFTHPFIFVFFPLAIFFDRYLVSNIFRSTNEGKKISLWLLTGIYLLGYLFRFLKLHSLTKRMIFPDDGRGEAWYFFAWLTGDFQILGLREYDTFPLYRFVSYRTYLISRYSNYFVLISVTGLLVYVIVRRILKLKSFDVSISLSAGIFFLLGLIIPVILGQRAFQVGTLNLPRYFSTLLKNKRKFLVFILTLFIIIAPLLFTSNRAINHSLVGGRYFQNEDTMHSGRFIMEKVESEDNILISEFSFYPGRNIGKYNFTIYTTRHYARGDVEREEIDIFMFDSKQSNKIEYYGLENDELFLENNTHSRVYDNGDAYLYLTGH